MAIKTTRAKAKKKSSSSGEVVKKTNPTAKQFIEKLNTFRSAEELKKYHRYFRFDEKSKTGDAFIGVRMGTVFELAKEFISMEPSEIEKLLESRIHEVRAGGCSIMGKQYKAPRTTETRKKELYDLYLKRHDRINDWDLVDLAAYKVVGGYLFEFEKPREILYELAHSSNLWERRTSIVSTLHFIMKKETEDCFRIAEILSKEKEDLVNKAVGWALREAGKVDRKRLLQFLDQHASVMPRVTLRYSIERLEEKLRKHYLSLKKTNHN
ncbi:DNA alkylation repair protein [Leptospira idonii]|uniref:DNA alkylation repair protein n=1 Tax=Leptospira idonii TaxID=1193500 RepID=A0A4R9M5B0_9LEPT|nr:DNA alkylation repair protein [Leptospira idonii]TGN19908.1 DNA alkylation repair protein [Leptospira idonii]